MTCDDSWTRQAWPCGAALAEGATTLVTSGAAQSNHARLTAAAACRCWRAETGPLRIRRDQAGPGYGVLTPEARTAMEDAARCEGLILDPVYTAKALAGLAAAVRDGDVRPGERTVFVHTGGLPGLLS